jgi:hypothetical protein
VRGVCLVNSLLRVVLRFRYPSTPRGMHQHRFL